MQRVSQQFKDISQVMQPEASVKNKKKLFPVTRAQMCWGQNLVELWVSGP